MKRAAVDCTETVDRQVSSCSGWAFHWAQAKCKALGTDRRQIDDSFHKDEGSDQGVGLLQGLSGLLLPFKCFLSQHTTGSCSSSFMQLLLGCCYGVTQGSILLHGKAHTFCLLDHLRFSNKLAMLSLLAGINMLFT